MTSTRPSRARTPLSTRRRRPPLCALLPGLLALCATLAACGGDSGDGDTADAPNNDASNNDAPNNDAPNNDVNNDINNDINNAPNNAPNNDIPAPDICQELGLERLEMAPPEDSFLFGAVAGDFSVAQADGTRWTLSESWSGCESYIFVNYIQDLRANKVGPWEGDQLWASDLTEFLRVSAPNVHYFFSSFEDNDVSRRFRVTGLRDRFEAALEEVFPDEQERQQRRQRLHFVTDRTSAIEGSAGTFLRDYLDYARNPASRVNLGDRGQAPPPLPFVFAIDRGQRWDPGGSMDEVVGRPPIMAMAGFLGPFYNHRAAVAAQVAADTDAAVVTLLDDTVTARIHTLTVELPDAATMATFDTLEFDVEVTCPHRNPFACSEWDRIARIDLCLDQMCQERREVVRWITPYWRRGARRWLIDASPFIGLMLDGGAHTFRVEMGPEWERATERHTRMSLRFSDRGGPRPRGVELAYRGGNFNADYNSNHPPFGFSIPEEADRVELVVILSGHGQEGGASCAEWCDHRHEFTLAGVPVARLNSQEVAGTLRGCALRAGDGVPPGQWGNWAPGRAYWCPGMPVEALRFDMTGKARAGRRTSLFYRATLGDNGEPRGGNIDMSTYVVWYEDP